MAISKHRKYKPRKRNLEREAYRLEKARAAKAEKLGVKQEAKAYDPKVDGPAIWDLIGWIRPIVQWLKLHTLCVIIPCLVICFAFGRTRAWLDFLLCAVMILLAPNVEQAQFQHEREKALILKWYKKTHSNRAKRFTNDNAWFDKGVDLIVDLFRKKAV